MNFPFQDLWPETALASKAAIQAGKVILKVYNTNFKVTLKGENDPLTEADLISNQMIMAELGKTGYPILSEEGKEKTAQFNCPKIWIVDPLDGTKDFIKKNGEFSVMIALISESVPILGIVYQPTENLLYCVQKGQGIYAQQNNKWTKLEGSKEITLQKFTAIMSSNHFTERDNNFIQSLGIKKISIKGSGGLKVGEICKSNAQIYLNSGNKQKLWDTAASHCMISEVGGRMTDVFGNDFKYNTKDIIHANGVLVTNGTKHDYIVKKYKEFIKT